jgi:hypothetical protein
MGFGLGLAKLGDPELREGLFGDFVEDYYRRLEERSGG